MSNKGMSRQNGHYWLKGVVAMTEAEWLASTDLPPVLEFVRSKVNDRRLRLFAVACCRQVWHLVPEGQEREAVCVAERFADGQASRHDLESASFYGNHYGMLLDDGAVVACFAQHDLKSAALAATVFLRRGGRGACDLFRDIFGNPVRPVTLNPIGRTSTVLALAQQMYESRDFTPMPVLADALQDAGCDNWDILAHCRGDSPHVRGCWVVDLILGKE